jgi:hypothetical protein
MNVQFMYFVLRSHTVGIAPLNIYTHVTDHNICYFKKVNTVTFTTQIKSLLAHQASRERVGFKLFS